MVCTGEKLEKESIGKKLLCRDQMMSSASKCEGSAEYRGRMALTERPSPNKGSFPCRTMAHTNGAEKKTRIS